MYADDTQIFSSSYDANELVIKLNSDLANVRDWLIENKLQMHPSKSKLMFIGSSYNLNNKNTEQPVVVNNTPVSRTDTHKCLRIHIDEKLNWDSHIDMICKKASAGILGFHVTSQALLKLVSAMLVSLRCQIYANNRPFLQ